MPRARHFPNKSKHRKTRRERDREREEAREKERAREREKSLHTLNIVHDHDTVPMGYFPFRQFVLSGKNRYDINHAVVQKVVQRKIREPF